MTDYTPSTELVERLEKAIRHCRSTEAAARAALKAMEPELRRLAELERVNADQKQILSAFSKEIDAEELAKGLRARDELWKPRRRG